MANERQAVGLEKPHHDYPAFGGKNAYEHELAVENDALAIMLRARPEALFTHHLWHRRILGRATKHDLAQPRVFRHQVEQPDNVPPEAEGAVNVLALHAEHDAPVRGNVQEVDIGVVLLQSHMVEVAAALVHKGAAFHVGVDDAGSHIVRVFEAQRIQQRRGVLLEASSGTSVFLLIFNVTG